METRVYILLDVAENMADQVISTVRGGKGVTTADALDGPPDVILVLEARNRQRLAELTNRVLASVEAMTESITVLPSRDCCDISTVKKERVRIKSRSWHEAHRKSKEKEGNIADGSQTDEQVRAR